MRYLSSLFLILTLMLPVGVQAEPNPYTTQATMQSAATGNVNGTLLNTNIGGYGFQLVTFVVTGTFSATVNPEGTQDGTNWQALFCMPISGGAGATTFTAAGGWRCNLGGAFVQVRARISGYASGSVTVTGMASFAGTVSNTSYPASAPSSGVVPYYDPTWYGADATGVADSTTAFQTAINAAIAASGKVWCPPGTYKLSAQLLINGTMDLEGAGWGCILKVDATAARFIPILVQGTSFAAVNGVVLRNFKLDGSSKGTLDAGLIQVNDAVGFLVDHVWVTSGGTPGESASQGVNGIAVAAGALGQVGSEGAISNNLVEATTKAGINWSTESVEGLISGNIVRNCTGNTQTPGIQVFGGYNGKVIGNSVHDNQGVGILVGTSGGVGTYRNARYALIANNHIYNNGQGTVAGDGILVANAAASAQQFGRMILSGNVVYTNGVNVNSNGIHVQNDNNILVSGNYIYLNSLNGIKVEAAQNVAVTDNVLESNNTANSANQAGVYLLAASTATLGSVSVANNKMFNSAGQHQKYPVYFDNSAAQSVVGVSITDNDASGHETSDGLNFDFMPTRLFVRHRFAGQQTTSATPTNIFYATLNDNSAARVTVTTTGLQSGGSNRAMYNNAALAYRNGGAATLQGAVQTAYAVASNGTWNQTINVTGNNVQAQVTGVAATTITWDSLMELQTE